MLINILILLGSLFLVGKGSTLATKYAALLAKNFRLSKYVVGFIIIAVISILPETFIAINAALQGNPSFGLGTLFGSNIADLSLVFAVILTFAGRSLKIENKILKNRKIYPIFLALPLLLGLDGYFSRSDGLVLIVMGGIFYYLAIKEGVDNHPGIKEGNSLRNFFMLLIGMAALLFGSHLIVSSASALALSWRVNPVLIGMLIVGVGTTIPEMLFALKSIQKKDDSLAVGDLLGTVLADATIVVGILALISPFAFSRTIIYVTGFFMVLTAFCLYRFMNTGRALSRKEAYFLLFIWLIFVLTEFFVNRYW